MYIKTDESSKYDYEKLDPASEEFNFLKETFMSTYFGLLICLKFNNFHIYKVNERNPVNTAVKPVNNLMLFHGTSYKGVTGILREGFRNSEKGWFGKGVYMTDCSEVAIRYAAYNAEYSFSNYFIFVNEVLESEKLQTFTFDRNVMYERGDVSTQPKHQFEKHISKLSLIPTKKDYTVDVEGRRYVKIHEANVYDQYIAKASVVIPRYLIVLEKTDLMFI